MLGTVPPIFDQDAPLLPPAVSLTGYFALTPTPPLWVKVAVIAGGDEHVQNAAYAYGRQLGIAFQLIDDLLDVSCPGMLCAVGSSHFLLLLLLLCYYDRAIRRWRSGRVELPATAVIRLRKNPKNPKKRT